jgi:hypothetical protein
MAVQPGKTQYLEIVVSHKEFSGIVFHYVNDRKLVILSATGCHRDLPPGPTKRKGGPCGSKLW